MANNFKNVWVGLRFKPVTTLTSDLLGEVQSFSTDSKTYLHNGTTRSPLVTAAHAETLTTKTIDADNNTISNLEVDNLKAGVLNTSTTLTGASDLQVPSALAVKTYVDNTFSPQTDVADLVTLTGVPANSTDLGTFTGVTIPDGQTIKAALQSLETGLENHLADAVDAHDASAISSIPSGNLAATDVQAALNELQSDIDTRALDSNLQAHITDISDAHDASAISVVPASGITSIDVQAALEELSLEIAAGGNGDVFGPASSTDNAIARFDGITGKLIQNSVVTVSDTGVVAGSSIDADTNTITNIENADIKAGAAIDRTKLASGTANAVVHNDGSGVMTNSADLLVTTNALTLANTKHLEIQAVTDSTTTGAAASLTAFVAGAVRLTNVSLTSIANIPAGTNGQDLTIFNRTGVDVTVSDSSAALGTAADRILTGTGSTITFANNAALNLKYDSTTARWQIVGGTGSGTGESASLDTIFQLTASEQLTDWTSGDNATFLGGGTLSGTFVKETTTPLHGTASYKYTQAASSLDDYIASAVQPVDLRFRAQQVYLTFPYQYDGLTGDIQAIVYCNTTSAIITSATDVVQGTAGATQSLVVSCVIPATCTGVRVGFHVKALNSGKIFSFDDISLSTSLLQSAQLNNVTETISYTPTLTGFGTVASPSFKYRRDGEFLYVYGNFTTGTVAAALASITLPTGLTIDTTKVTIANTTGTTGLTVGDYYFQAASGYGSLVTATGTSSSLVYFANLTTNSTNTIPQNGNAIAGNTQNCTIKFAIPIAGWTAGNTAIVTPTQQISSDTLPFTYAGSGTFTPATLVNAPVGTFITFTHAGSTNTRTQTTSAPTQTTSDMNTNGILITPRSYAATSTFQLPAFVMIQIGKGLSSVNPRVFKSTGKTTVGFLDVSYSGTASFGIPGKDYNPTTGILTIDAATGLYGTNTGSANIQYEDGTSATSGYITFAASTSPSIAALPILQPRIAVIADIKASGTAGGTPTAAAQNTRTLNTIISDPYGIITSLTANTITLQAGTYKVLASAPAYRSDRHQLRFRNTTDSTTAITGSSAYTATGDDSATHSFIDGIFTITAAKAFQVTHYITSAVGGANGLGIAATTGEVETYAKILIEKIRD